MTRYRTIVADPPWVYDATPRGSTAAGPVTSPALPYPQMSVSEIAALPVSDLAEKDAHLWLWTTNRYDAFHIIQAWGFAFRQMLVWRKTGAPTPFCASVAPNHAEYLLFARRGRGASLMDRHSTNVVEAPATTIHSRKPDVFMDIIERVSPEPRIEMFSRRARLGWDTWGNQSLHGGEAS